MAPHQQTVAAAVAELFASRPELPVAAVYLFGSESRGTAHRESDVDIALLLEGAPDRDRDFRLRVELGSELIGHLHRNEVDLVILNQAPPLFARAIVTSGQRVFCRNELAARDFVRDVQLKAADLEPFVERGRRRLLDRLAP